LIVEQVFAHGFSAVICHGFCGSDSVATCVDTAHENRGECYVVAEMSHPGAEEFFHGGTAEKIAALARESDADGIIAPATRPDRVMLLREIIGKKKIYSPGIGAQGGTFEPLAGIVVEVTAGPQIYTAPDPAAAAALFHSIRR
jgi:orotidine-5'-phosphate decarboxylase